MAATISTQKLGDYFSSWQKILSALGAVVFVVSTLSIAYYKIGDNANDIENNRKEFEHRVEDQRTLNVKLSLRVKDLEDRIRQDEIDAAYNKGKNETYLQLQQQMIQQLQKK